MPVWKGVHSCLERSSFLSGKGSFLSGKEFIPVWKGFIPVWKGVHACLERGSFLSGKGSMPV